MTFENGLDEAEASPGAFARPWRRANAPTAISPCFSAINALSRGLETAFVKQRVRSRSSRAWPSSTASENKDVVAYLRLLVNPRDDLSFLRAVNEPARGVGKVSLEHLRTHAEPRELSLLAAAARHSKDPAIKGKAARGAARLRRADGRACRRRPTRRRMR